MRALLHYIYIKHFRRQQNRRERWRAGDHRGEWRRPARRSQRRLMGDRATCGEWWRHLEGAVVFRRQ